MLINRWCGTPLDSHSVALDTKKASGCGGSSTEHNQVATQ